jgi:hypothetical protein
MMQDFVLFFQYKIWKGWAIWKHFVRRKKKKLYLASIEKLLFLSNPLLAKVLLQIQTVPTKFISEIFKLFKLQHHNCDWHKSELKTQVIWLLNSFLNFTLNVDHKLVQRRIVWAHFPSKSQTSYLGPNQKY